LTPECFGYYFVVEPVVVEPEVESDSTVVVEVELDPDYLCFCSRIPYLFIFKRLFIINI
jgi:hypothetical protein